jgi:peptidyl-dipeptidase Dcp
MLDGDACPWFVDHGGLRRANGARFRDTILSRGSAGEYAKMHRDFRGQDPSIDPMLRRRGIEAEQERDTS